MAADGTKHSAFIVGKAFTTQYYNVLHKHPSDVHKFYRDGSKLSWAEGLWAPMNTVTTMAGINQMVMSRDYSDACAEIKSVDSQESFSGGVLVVVTGVLSLKRQRRRNFVQTFFLAPQDPRGFYVLNDIFRFVDPEESLEEEGGVGDWRGGEVHEGGGKEEDEDDEGYQQPPPVVKHTVVAGSVNGIPDGKEAPPVSQDPASAEYVVRDVIVDEASQQQSSKGGEASGGASAPASGGDAPAAAPSVPGSAGGEVLRMGNGMVGEDSFAAPTTTQSDAATRAHSSLVQLGPPTGAHAYEEDHGGQVVRDISEAPAAGQVAVPVLAPAPPVTGEAQNPAGAIPVGAPFHRPEVPSPATPASGLPASLPTTSIPSPLVPGPPAPALASAPPPVPAPAPAPATAPIPVPASSIIPAPPPTFQASSPAPASAAAATQAVATAASPSPGLDDPSAPKRSYASAARTGTAPPGAAAPPGAQVATSGTPAGPGPRATLPAVASAVSGSPVRAAGPAGPAAAATGPILPQPPSAPVLQPGVAPGPGTAASGTSNAPGGSVGGAGTGGAGILSSAPQGVPAYVQGAVIVPPPAPGPPVQGSEDVNPQIAEAEADKDARTIYIRNLPAGITHKQIGEYFSKEFGRLKQDRINIRQNKQASLNTVYAFVEFEDVSSAKAAAQRREMVVEGFNVRIEQKKATPGSGGGGGSRGGYRPRTNTRGERSYRDGGRARSGAGGGGGGSGPGVPGGGVQGAGGVQMRQSSGMRGPPDASRAGSGPGPGMGVSDAGVRAAPGGVPGDESRPQPGQEGAGVPVVGPYYGGVPSGYGPGGPGQFGGQRWGGGGEGSYRGSAGRGPGPGAAAPMAASTAVQNGSR